MEEDGLGPGHAVDPVEGYGSVVLVTMLFKTLTDAHEFAMTSLCVGVGCIAVALLALWKLEESFHKDLDYLEHHGA